LHGADVHVKGPNGNTPLHYASYYGHTEIAQLLLEHGADVDALGANYNTPLLYAENRGYQKIAALLRDARDHPVKYPKPNTAVSTSKNKPTQTVAQTKPAKKLTAKGHAPADKKPRTTVSAATTAAAMAELIEEVTKGYEGFGI
jgi:ankyrin repeat protein